MARAFSLAVASGRLAHQACPRARRANRRKPARPPWGSRFGTAPNIEQRLSERPSEKFFSDGLVFTCIRLRFVFTKLIVPTIGLHVGNTVRPSEKKFQTALVLHAYDYALFYKANRTYAWLTASHALCGNELVQKRIATRQLRELDKFIGFVRLLDIAGAANHGGDAGLLELTAFGGISHFQTA